jgi:transposase
MSNLSVTKPYQPRRRHAPEFKARLVAECQKPGASVSRIALDNGLNANMLRRWINEARRAGNEPSTAPAFVPVKLPAGATPVVKKHRAIRIEIPRASGPVVVEWPAEQAHQCAVFLRELLP